MLAAGGTKHHSELLKPFGLDARDPTFWQGGLGVIERMIGSWRGWSEDDVSESALIQSYIDVGVIRYV